MSGVDGRANEPRHALRLRGTRILPLGGGSRGGAPPNAKETRRRWKGLWRRRRRGDGAGQISTAGGKRRRWQRRWRWRGVCPHWPALARTGPPQRSLLLGEGLPNRCSSPPTRRARAANGSGCARRRPGLRPPRDNGCRLSMAPSSMAFYAHERRPPCGPCGCGQAATRRNPTCARAMDAAAARPSRRIESSCAAPR